MVRPTTTIREMKPSELARVAILWRDIYRHTYPDIDVSSDPAYWEGGLQSKVKAASRIYVAEADDRLIGLMVKTGSYLDQLYIHPSFQGHQIGTRFLSLAREEEPQYLHLHTLAQNERAIAFYEGRGFRITERGIAPDEQVPDVHMEWSGPQ